MAIFADKVMVRFWAMGTGAGIGAHWPSLTPINSMSTMLCVEQFTDRPSRGKEP